MSHDPDKFTILIDPWLGGDSIIGLKRFAFARHRVEPSIKHLSEIPPPSVVIISQDKTDHCHEPTLRQLKPELENTVILAAPQAAKKIQVWKYFNTWKVVS